MRKFRKTAAVLRRQHLHFRYVHVAERQTRRRQNRYLVAVQP